MKADIHTALVDVIMPTYRPDLTLLRRAVESVVSQGFTGWRLIIAKDGGDEDVAGVVKSIGDGRIMVMELPHKGKPSALNAALAEAKGRYVAYLDDDDIWYPDHLGVCVSGMQDNGYRFVHTDIYEVRLMQKASGGYKETSRGVMNMGPLTDVFLWRIGHSNAAHERSLLKLTGGYDESRRYFIDWDMFIRLAEHAEPVHLEHVTGEHYIYLDSKGKKLNRISSVHNKYDETKSEFERMILRSKGRLTDEAVLAIVEDLLNYHFMRHSYPLMHTVRTALSKKIKPSLRAFRDFLTGGK